MLYRTRKTTSATLNRLDLGTRLFARPATTNMGPQSLRTRHAHPQAVVEIARAGIIPAMMYPPFGGERMAETPGSTFGLRPWWYPSCAPRPSTLVPSDRRSVVPSDDRSRRSGAQARAARALAAVPSGGVPQGRG